MKKLTYAIIALLSFLCVPLCAQMAGKKPTVVIVPFEAKSSGIGQDDCDIITESFESEYARMGSALVVNRNTFKKIQAEQAFQNSDWSNSDKTAKLGEALNAQQLIFGTLRIYNDILFVIVQVQDIKTLAVLASMHTQVKDIMELLETIPDICKNIAAQMQGENAPAVVPKNTPSTKTAQTARSGTEKTYQIGDIGPGGGWIFYVSETGFPVYKGDKKIVCHYLECAPTSLGASPWCSKKRKKSCCHVDTTDGVGAGYRNTRNIIKANHKGGSLPSICAAIECKDHYYTNTTKKGEWYLPSNFELDLLYKTLVRNGIIKSNTRHWSSTQLESSSTHAWAQSFNDGKQSTVSKDSWLEVRAIRAF